MVGRSSGARVDTRPVTLPAALLGEPLDTGSIEDEYEEQMRPLLAKIFGTRPSAIGRYTGLADSGEPHRLADLVVGRGPVVGRGAGDVSVAGPHRARFGDITCAHMMGKKQVLDAVIICWYSTPAFGASLLFDDENKTSMLDVAAALDAAVNEMRGDPAGGE